MQRRRVIPVRVRILAAILAVTALGLVTAGGTSYLFQRGHDLAEIDDELRQNFDVVRLIVEGGETATATTGDPLRPEASAFATADDLAYEIVRAVTPPLSGGTLGIVDGTARFVPGVATQLELTSTGFVDEVLDATDGRLTVLDTTTIGDTTVRYLAIPITLAGSGSTAIFVSAIAIEARLAELHAVMAVYLWVAVGAVLVVAVVGWLVAGRLLSPVRELQDTAARISATDLGERIPVAGNDDLSELTRTINAMIARLESSFDSQQRLVDDVRHELSTPITIVRGHLELLDPTNPDDVAQTRAIAIDELDRMGSLVTDIAEVAEAERPARHHPGPVPIDTLTREVYEKMRVIPDHDWALDEVADGVVVLDGERITQAWLQLAANAAKYSPQGTRIAMGSARRDRSVRLWVEDEGPGIAEEARERIFTRFGRASDARGVDGSGLGLAIVSAIVRAHGGQVDLDSTPGSGSRFTMVIPTDDEPWEGGGER